MRPIESVEAEFLASPLSWHSIVPIRVMPPRELIEGFLNHSVIFNRDTGEFEELSPRPFAQDTGNYRLRSLPLKRMLEEYVAQGPVSVVYNTETREFQRVKQRP